MESRTSLLGRGSSKSNEGGEGSKIPKIADVIYGRPNRMIST